MNRISFILFILCTQLNFGQKTNLHQIKETINYNNNHFQYEKSMVLLNQLLDQDTLSAYTRFELYLLKSNTYKRLFNYEEVFQNLRIAELEGFKSGKKEKVKNIIRAERAFAYFDTQNLVVGNRLVQEVVRTHYKDLSIDQKIYILIMEATSLMGNLQMLESEKKLEEAQEIAAQNCPRELPLVFAKKTVLYNKMKRLEKQNEAFQLGLFYAHKYNILKYEMYMYEVMKYICIDNNDIENLKFYQRKFDSLNNAYNAIIYNGKITLIEKKFINQRHRLENENERNLNASLLGLIVVLLLVSLLLFLLYKKNKAQRQKVEEENKRIHNEIARLTALTNEKGEKLDLSKFNLTERQIEIINLIKQGKTNKEIGKELFISENTVKYHIHIIFDILDIDHRSKLR